MTKSDSRVKHRGQWANILVDRVGIHAGADLESPHVQRFRCFAIFVNSLSPSASASIARSTTFCVRSRDTARTGCD